MNRRIYLRWPDEDDGNGAADDDDASVVDVDGFISMFGYIDVRHKADGKRGDADNRKTVQNTTTRKYRSDTRRMGNAET